jgi:hypothetical protein
MVGGESMMVQASFFFTEVGSGFHCLRSFSFIFVNGMV